MSDKTNIEWTEASWNPTRGCSRVSEGCGSSRGGGCYAERVAARFSGPGKPFEGFARFVGATGSRLVSATPIRIEPRVSGDPRWTGRVELIPSMLDLPLRWKKPRRVFVNSMSDLFHERLSNEDIAAVFGVMAACPQHCFQILTKRAERMRQWVEWAARETGGGPWTVAENAAAGHLGADVIQDHAVPRPWPLPHVWLGVSVEDQATANERIPHLLACPAAVRWVSYEPALGPVDFAPWLPEKEEAERPTLDWLVCGGESGPGARPFDIAWAREAIRQCRAAETAAFCKQLGSRPMMRADTIEGLRAGDHPEREWPEGTRFSTAPGHMGTVWQGRWAMLRDRKGGDPSEWPEDLRVREYPKEAT